MLSASYLASCSDDIMKIYAQLENDIICSMAKRFSKIGIVSDYAKVQADVLKQIGGLQNDIRTYLTKYDAEAQKEIIRLFNSAMNKATAKDLKYFEAAKRELSGSQKQILETTAERLRSQAIVSANEKTRQAFANGEAIKCFSGLQRLTQTIAATAQGDFVNSVNSAYMKTISGAFDYNTAIRDSIKQLAEKGVHTVEYTDSGKIINRSIESAVRMNVLTGINLSASQQTINNCKDTETDLVEVSAHLGARPSHEEWQGKVYCLSGERDYVDGNGQIQHARNFYEVCRLGEPDGICGINCRHSYYPYYEGMETEYSKGELDEYKERTVKVNGEDVSIYEAEQKLRQYERNIRRYKREVDALKIVNQDYSKEAAKLKFWQDNAKALCKESGIRRDYDREFVGKISSKEKEILNNDKVNYGSPVQIKDGKEIYLPTKEEEKRYNKHVSMHFINDDNHLSDATKGNPMSFEEADGNRVNPNYIKDTFAIKNGYDDTCVASVYVFEARMRGFDVEVLPRFYNNKVDKLAHHISIGWNEAINKIDTSSISNVENLKKLFYSEIKNNQRFMFCGNYLKKNYGHAIVILKEKGKLKFYDSLIGEVLSNEDLETFLNSIKIGKDLDFYRIDNLTFNHNICNYIMEKRK